MSCHRYLHSKPARFSTVRAKKRLYRSRATEPEKIMFNSNPSIIMNETNHHNDCLSPIAVSLLILFIALRLTHVISWSWLWVLAPAWVYALVVVISAVTYLVWTNRKNRNSRK